MDNNLSEKLMILRTTDVDKDWLENNGYKIYEDLAMMTTEELNALVASSNIVSPRGTIVGTELQSKLEKYLTEGFVPVEHENGRVA